jgi:hypothetical protein
MQIICSIPVFMFLCTHTLLHSQEVNVQKEFGCVFSYRFKLRALKGERVCSEWECVAFHLSFHKPVYMSFALKLLCLLHLEFLQNLLHPAITTAL